jgi:hypothetical protein
MTPDSAHQSRKLGYECVVETGAGRDAGFRTMSIAPPASRWSGDRPFGCLTYDRLSEGIRGTVCGQCQRFLRAQDCNESPFPMACMGSHSISDPTSPLARGRGAYLSRLPISIPSDLFMKAPSLKAMVATKNPLLGEKRKRFSCGSGSRGGGAKATVLRYAGTYVGVGANSAGVVHRHVLTSDRQPRRC